MQQKSIKTNINKANTHQTLSIEYNVKRLSFKMYSTKQKPPAKRQYEAIR